MYLYLPNIVGKTGKMSGILSLATVALYFYCRIISYMDENLPKRLPERHQAVLAREILNTEEEMLVD